ncbi:MAG: Gfo/Idh/MocA family oxidoreductase [Atopobiaceae bacterium]|nr:Gfo/Idh/MocA family oxidoreductase [Atopobiaceae bacterium]
MVRFGILGAGNIARRFAASLSHESRAELVAASCRTTQKAAAFLENVPHADGARAYGSHDELLKDPSVDAIYLALPHDLHLAWALEALDAGKAVLCEKPATLSAAQMQDVARASAQTGICFMEAMKPRFVAIHQPVMGAIDKIGAIRYVEATLCNDMLGLVEGTGTYHMTPGPGAGVLLDCGTYCASWLAELCAGEPELLSCESVLRDGIDVYVNARLSFGGVEATLECAFDRAKPRQAVVIGEHGRVVVDELHRPQHATLELVGEDPVELDVPYVVDDFFGEVSHFVSLLEGAAPQPGTALESPLMSLDDSLRCAHILDVVRAGFCAK